jgi:hypothetical protein
MMTEVRHHPEPSITLIADLKLQHERALPAPLQPSPPATREWMRERLGGCESVESKAVVNLSIASNGVVVVATLRDPTRDEFRSLCKGVRIELTE